jgi:hypothetical protein
MGGGSGGASLELDQWTNPSYQVSMEEFNQIVIDSGLKNPVIIDDMVLLPVIIDMTSLKILLQVENQKTNFVTIEVTKN